MTGPCLIHGGRLWPMQEEMQGLLPLNPSLYQSPPSHHEILCVNQPAKYTSRTWAGNIAALASLSFLEFERLVFNPYTHFVTMNGKELHPQRVEKAVPSWPALSHLSHLCLGLTHRLLGGCSSLPRANETLLPSFKGKIFSN